ncbi:MAG: hypothetical protein RLZZ229_502 [Actinomycetota bacterium]|jgi:zinc transporter, ZIP family
MAAVATLLGCLPVAFGKAHSSLFNGLALIVSAIAMASVSVVELIPSALQLDLGWQDSLFWLAAGALMYLVARWSTRLLTAKKESLFSSMLLVTVALTLHNIPEGTAAIAATSADLETGISTGIAIGFQNLPEGLSIAALTLAAGLSRIKAFGLVGISVLAEIFGAALIWLNQDYLTTEINSHLLLAVGGLMLAISGFELFPDGLRLLREPKAGRKTPSHH